MMKQARMIVRAAAEDEAFGRRAERQVEAKPEVSWRRLRIQCLHDEQPNKVHAAIEPGTGHTRSVLAHRISYLITLRDLRMLGKII